MKDHATATENKQCTDNECSQRSGWLDNVDANVLKQESQKMESDFADCVDDGLEDLGSADDLF